MSESPPPRIAIAEQESLLRIPSEGVSRTPLTDNLSAVRPRPSSVAVSGPERPRVLLVCTLDWYHVALLAVRLSRTGFAVAALCPKRHALRHTAAVVHCFRYTPRKPQRVLRDAIRSWDPVLVIPGDDAAVNLLTELHAECLKGFQEDDRRAAAIIERSFGSPAAVASVQNKAVFIGMARRLSLRVPDTTEVSGLESLSRHWQSATFPLVLKRDVSFGGAGVAFAHSPEEAALAYRRLTARPNLVTILRQMATALSLKPLRQSLSRPGITVQACIDGRPANRAVLCWRGEVLGGVTVKAIETHPYPTGPATVVELTANDEIDAATREIVRELGLSGFCGFDFIIDESSQRPFLLEINARPTEATLLAASESSDLCRALARLLGADGDSASPPDAAFSRAIEEGTTVTLFPKEWIRRQDSKHLASPHHNVPWDEPDLLAYAIVTANKWRRMQNAGWAARLARRFLWWRT